MSHRLFSITLRASAVTALLAACGGAPSATPTPVGEINVGVADYTGPLPQLQELTVHYTVEPFIENLNFPVAMQFAPDGRLFFTEKYGAVRVADAGGKLQPQPVIVLPTDAAGERGLLGIALDPNFSQNHYVWVFHTWSDPERTRDKPYNRVVRFTEKDGVGSDPQVAFEASIEFTDSTILNGGNIHFGPDGMLYITIGTTNNIAVANEPDTPQGKIHRVIPTVPVGIPPDNPDPNSTIFARGFRNSFDFTFSPINGLIYATENGPDCDDELNLVVAGGNYGWREEGLCEDQSVGNDYPFKRPLVSWTPPISPTGVMVYTGDKFPEWQNHIFLCAYNLGRMVVLKTDESGAKVLGGDLRWELGRARCATDIVTGPDGFIYFNDINAIYRLVPAN
ncbi:MAG: PQQ-dependent sugar dehydrogenase [Chloroflexota bacterium]